MYQGIAWAIEPDEGLGMLTGSEQKHLALSFNQPCISMLDPLLHLAGEI